MWSQKGIDQMILVNRNSTVLNSKRLWSSWEKSSKTSAENYYYKYY